MEESEQKKDGGKETKERSFKGIFVVMMISLLIAAFWERLDFVKNALNYVLQPTAGWLLGWDLHLGLLLIVFILTFITTIVQKYATDQETMKELKKEQKVLQEEMKKYREHPQKIMDMQKKQMELLPKMMKLSMRPVIFTGIPFILLFRWFIDYFKSIEDPLFFGFLTWFWFYLIFAVTFNIILRKVLKVV